jgi:hypothetical protein
MPVSKSSIASIVPQSEQISVLLSVLLSAPQYCPANSALGTGPPQRGQSMFLFISFSFVVVGSKYYTTVIAPLQLHGDKNFWRKITGRFNDVSIDGYGCQFDGGSGVSLTGVGMSM